MDQETTPQRNGTDPTKLPPDHPNYVAKRRTPVFDCVIGMVLSYTRQINKRTRPSMSRKPQSDTIKSIESTSESTLPNNNNKNSTAPEQFICYWVNRSGRQEIPVVIAKPKRKRFLTLQDRCRIILSKQMSLWQNNHLIEDLPLPGPIQKYIKMYPYPA